MGPSPYRKGDLAQVKHWLPDGGPVRRAPGIHMFTQSEYEAEAANPYYRELDSAGEPRIPPRSTPVRLDSGTILHVLRVRVRPPDLYNRHARGWVLALNTATGQEVYVQEKYLEPVE
jgi:hypothetical protein